MQGNERQPEAEILWKSEKRIPAVRRWCSKQDWVDARRTQLTRIALYPTVVLEAGLGRCCVEWLALLGNVARADLTLKSTMVHAPMAMPRFGRLVFDDKFDLKAPPGQVFPLLCPVREHDWIPTWKAEILYSQSGYAELDCTFRTNSPAEGERTWICTRYEPDHAVSYATYSDVGYFMCLDITLRCLGNDLTEVTWLRRFVATTMSGQDWISSLDPTATAKATQKLASLLDHFLTTGTMLRV